MFAPAYDMPGRFCLENLRLKGDGRSGVKIDFNCLSVARNVSLQTGLRRSFCTGAGKVFINRHIAYRLVRAVLPP